MFISQIVRIGITPCALHTQLNKSLKTHTHTFIYTENICTLHICHWHHRLYLNSFVIYCNNESPHEITLKQRIQKNKK